MEYEERKRARLAAGVTPSLKQRVTDYIDAVNAEWPDDAKPLDESKFLRRAVEFYLDYHSNTFAENGGEIEQL